MARSGNQRLKPLYLLRFFRENTDEQHPAHIRDMIDYLAQYEIPAERKGLYEDIAALRDYGADIVCPKQGEYYLASRDFELAELKLLVDSVQASRFITAKKSGELIGKLEKLAGKFGAQQLHRQVYVLNRIKNGNESIYYTVDRIHAAIADDRQIRFQYFSYGVDKSRKLRHDGAFYRVSPRALSWADESYYLIAFDAKEQALRHYRVDRMTNAEPLDIPREGGDKFPESDIARYASRVFGMFRGPETELRIRFTNNLVNAVLDRFGQEQILIPDGDGHFTATVRVAVSPQFYGWLCGFGNEAVILSPAEEAEKLRDYVRDILCGYEKP